MTDPELTELDVKRSKSLRYMFNRVPFTVALGMELTASDVESATVRMPFSDLTDNGGKTPHGGAIAALIDNAGAAAAWAGHDYNGVRGATISLTVNFVGAPGESACVATARVVRRAKDLVYLNVEVTSEAGRPVASAVVIYRIGQ